MKAFTSPIATRRRHRSAGQALAEFALVVTIFLTVVGAIIQFGVILWSQNTITEIARDTARWAVTQSISPCDGARGGVASTADTLATQRALIGYSAGTWSSASSVAGVGSSGVGVDWTGPTDSFLTDCPPSDNMTVWMVRVRINHAVPVFLPGLDIVAANCGGSFCISSDAELRMEPKRP